ncbi:MULTISPECIES: phenylalanine--tRNA ligase subunit beta [Cyanophyceae]|uniref:phenylalanine--tRNA ligase subunit beta n=1 Tax=Cyanophyceae TaxID=3028117 RepID=UPI00233124A1|nr:MULTISPECIES: phenylalanine--tRNA ligase subunit beta [Cyanophyceae]MDB9307049.1 phenylalanine--tRNA ligase subunit beta [Nodularia spumigena CS-591/12]MDB9316774.1 phenylalanine--tRNA ligase subunit beta [Nodularia spumigena CS-590/01A]MDB9325124.1 phenylalanine--tRNA ligase subunit beta [Nodularia spumigena CS-590/02]MDB9334741.1 phenylalanine--tRNA ligase subunit beta [Nodularia spumigena CS-590/01]MDB9337888.1 phenylalanine--tRNA ligase subunit beta [Nodularia spumigena CS-589/07]
MRISLNWLRELVEIKLSPEELAETLTMAGFEVEDIEDRHTWANGVVVGKVLERQPHPNADKLSVCQVDIGASETLNIVCGAPNVKADIYVPVATTGTYLPNIDLKIKPAKLRGVPSQGMICSLKELGLPTDVDGIHIFPQENLPLGSDVRPLLGLDDVILDVTATANRADALCMVGIAREVAALTGGKLSIPTPGATSVLKGAGNLALKIEDQQACPAYIGTVIEQVKIAPSPDWLQQRLRAAGVRPINNVVDITNFVLWEWGQPLHAFDKDRLESVAGGEGLKIGVRFANSGESLKTLDGQTRNLSTQNLLITANNKPVALAGVMGGEETEVHSGTQSLVLEAALFDSVAIRRSSRSVGLRSEASGRYERGVNRAELEIACNRALSLLSELAEGVIVQQEIADTRPDSSTWSRSIALRLDRVNEVLGPVDLGEEETGEVTEADVERILSALGCQLTSAGEGTWTVTVPPYRYRDLEREIDLIEELARLYGYDNFCDTLPEKSEAGYLSLEQELIRKVRAFLRAEGLTEVIHYSLVKPGNDRQVVLSNPLFAEYSALRTDLISGLIDAFQYNLEQGNGSLNGFDLGRIFWQEEDGLQETDAIAGIMGGDRSIGKWSKGSSENLMTWFDAKGILESVFQQLNLKVEYQPDCRDERLHPGRTASLWLGGNRLGIFGQLHPQLRQDKGLPDSVYVFHLDLNVLLDALDQDEVMVPKFHAYSTYPASDRDIAFFAPVKISVADIEKSINKAAKGLLESVELFDEYRGENVPAGQRSLAFRLIYRSSDRTLTEAEVEPVHNKVREALVEKFGVNLRS